MLEEIKLSLIKKILSLKLKYKWSLWVMHTVLNKGWNIIGHDNLADRYTSFAVISSILPTNAPIFKFFLHSQYNLLNTLTKISRIFNSEYI